MTGMGDDLELDQRVPRALGNLVAVASRDPLAIDPPDVREADFFLVGVLDGDLGQDQIARNRILWCQSKADHGNLVVRVLDRIRLQRLLGSRAGGFDCRLQKVRTTSQAADQPDQGQASDGLLKHAFHSFVHASPPPPALGRHQGIRPFRVSS